MNKQRRTAIEKLHERLQQLQGEIEDIKSEEEEYFDNMPESLQGGEKGEAAQSAIDALDSAYSSIEEALDSLNEASGE